VAQQGSPPRRSARPLQPDYRGRHDRPSERPGRPDWQQIDPFGPESEDDLPPWAEPNFQPARPAGTQRRRAAGRGQAIGAEAGPEAYDDPVGHDWQADGGPPGDQPPDAQAPRRPGRRGRAAATRLRKSRRRVYRWCGVAIVVCIIAAGLTVLLTHHTPKPSLYVTSLLPGEFKSVPNACGVSGSVLNQYLPDPGRTSAAEISENTESQCSFTLDRKPDFLVLEVSAQAYQPFAAASASDSAAGSASANAQDNYALTETNLRKPPKTGKARPLLSAAVISPLAKTGQQAFVAVQTEHASGIMTEVATVVIREHNVLITVSDSGQERGGGFGPVAVTTLEAGAEAAARDMLAKSLAEPRA
jgi:hypothetical protein